MSLRTLAESSTISIESVTLSVSAVCCPTAELFSQNVVNEDSQSCVQLAKNGGPALFGVAFFVGGHPGTNQWVSGGSPSVPASKGNQYGAVPNRAVF